MVLKVVLSVIMTLTQPHKDVEPLAEAVYMEARGSSPWEQFLVARVIINRAAHKDFPSSVTGVIYQNKPVRQFQYTKTKLSIDKRAPPYKKARSIVILALLLPPNVESVLYFHDHSHKKGFSWAKPVVYTKDFIFYRTK